MGLTDGSIPRLGSKEVLGHGTAHQVPAALVNLIAIEVTIELKLKLFIVTYILVYYYHKCNSLQKGL